MVETSGHNYVHEHDDIDEEEQDEDEEDDVDEEEQDVDEEDDVDEEEQDEDEEDDVDEEEQDEDEDEDGEQSSIDSYDEDEAQSSIDLDDDEEPRGSDGDESTDNYVSDGDASTDYDEESSSPPPPSPPLDQTSASSDLLSPSRHRIEETPDRIGLLPDSLLLHILSFLPMKDVVKTGVLSTRWVYLWTSVENISFSYRNIPNDFSYCNSLYEKGLRKFITFVDKTIILCAFSNVRKFCLDFNYERRFAPDVNVWVRFAMQKNVEELELNLYNRCPGNRYKLPQSLYANSVLAKLSLSKCKIIPPYEAVKWSSLRALTIKCSEVSSHAIGKILSGSPSLAFLELYRCWLFDDPLNINSASLKKLVIRGYRDPFREHDNSELVISAPKVLSLEIIGYIMHKKIQLAEVPSLVEAKLNYKQVYAWWEDCNANRDMLSGLLVSLQHVKDLTLGSFCIQVLSTQEVKGLPSPLLECKHLTLIMHMKKWDLPGIASVLQSSPDLETLVIDMASSCHSEFKFSLDFLSSYDFDGESYWTSQKHDFKCLLLHLKTIKIAGFRGGSHGFEVALVQFLLENSRVLEKMIVNTGRVGWPRCSTSSICSEFLQVTQKLLSFPRSSPRAVLMLPEINMT